MSDRPNINVTGVTGGEVEKNFTVGVVHRGTCNEGAKNTANNSNVGQRGDWVTATRTTFGVSTPPGARDGASSPPTKQSEKERSVKASAKNTANNSNVGQRGDWVTATRTIFGVSTPPGARVQHQHLDKVDRIGKFKVKVNAGQVVTTKMEFLSQVKPGSELIIRITEFKQTTEKKGDKNLENQLEKIESKLIKALTDERHDLNKLLLKLGVQIHDVRKGSINIVIWILVETVARVLLAEIVKAIFEYIGIRPRMRAALGVLTGLFRGDVHCSGGDATETETRGLTAAAGRGVESPSAAVPSDDRLTHVTISYSEMLDEEESN